MDRRGLRYRYICAGVRRLPSATLPLDIEARLFVVDKSKTAELKLQFREPVEADISVISMAATRPREALLLAGTRSEIVKTLLRSKNGVRDAPVSHSESRSGGVAKAVAIALARNFDLLARE